MLGTRIGGVKRRFIKEEVRFVRQSGQGNQQDVCFVKNLERSWDEVNVLREIRRQFYTVIVLFGVRHWLGYQVVKVCDNDMEELSKQVGGRVFY